MGHLAANCEGKAKRKAGEFDEKGDAEVVAKKPFQVTFEIFSFYSLPKIFCPDCLWFSQF